MGNMAFFRGGGYRRWLPPEIGSADEAVLVRRRCPAPAAPSSGGAARLAALGRAPLCRTVLMSQEAAGAWLRARQVVGCGLSPRCSLTLSGLSPRPVLCVQRALTALDGTVIEPQDIPLSLHWSRLPPETLLLAAGAWLLAKGQVPEIS